MFRTVYVLMRSSLLRYIMAFDVTIALENMTSKKSDLIITGKSKTYHEAYYLLENTFQKVKYNKTR